MSDPTPPEEPGEAPAPAPWAMATAEDVRACDIDARIPPEAPSDWHSLSSVLRAAASQDDADPGTTRVFRMLSQLLFMMLDAGNRDKPFRPALVCADGRRSAAMADFRPCVEALIAISAQSQHPAIVSRAADLAWMLERRRHDTGRVALAAYCRLLDDVVAGDRQFKHEVEQEGGRLGVDILRRCVVIARSRSFGDHAPDVTPLAERVKTARRRALEVGEAGRHLELARLALDYDIEKPETLAADIEKSVAGLDIAEGGHLIVDILKAAVRAYCRAGQAERAHVAKKRISDVYVTMSEAKGHSAMIASSHLADAITALAGVPNMRDGRRKLQHRLIDVQAGIADEMSSFSQPLDIEDLRAEVSKQVNGRSFYDSLFHFAVMAQPRDPEKIHEDAAEILRKHPLSGLLATSYHDREGKVRYVSPDARVSSTEVEVDLEAQIARHQILSRHVGVGLLDVVRSYIAPDVLMPVLSVSRFVPEGLENTFACGLSGFLRGDAVSALYVLTPLVEAGMRSCLKAAGYEVTTFDDARQTQEDKTLSALYRDQRADIEAVFGKALAFDIEQVFLHPAGPSLRHGVAHGLLHDSAPFSSDAFYACWLVLHLCLVPLYRYRNDLGLPAMPPPSCEARGD